MNRKKGFTLIELMVVVLIVGILAAVAIPILRGRIDSAKWSEGKAMLGSIATSIRAYSAEHGVTGTPPDDLGQSDNGLGFADGDLTGTYFVDTDFTLGTVTLSPLTFNITCTASTTNGPETPPFYTLNQAGEFGTTAAAP